MFKSLYLKLKHTYDELVAKTYLYFLLNSPWTLILTYLIFSLLISFGLVSFRLDPANPETFTRVRNSLAWRQFQLLDRTFEFYQYDRNFANKQLYVGYYVEIIVCAKLPNATRRDSNADLLKPEYNLINRTYLDEFNQLFDGIAALEVQDSDDRRVYKYDPDLCARRMSKCGTEGGLLREPRFQTKLLNHVVFYEDTDLKMAYADTELLDGIGFTVLFGKYRKEERRLESNSSLPNAALPGANYITHAGVFRVRFDFLSTTEKEKRLAVEFMKKFVDYMGRVERENMLRYLNVSYHASYLVNDEIQKYSSHDLKYILAAFGLFVVSMTISMWFSLSWSRLCRDRRVNIFVNGAGYLPFAILLQFVLTVTSTFGLTSLLNFSANPLCFTIVFVFLINGCHQSFVLYSNAQSWLNSRQREANISTSKFDNEPANDQISDHRLGLEDYLTRLAQRLIVPGSFGLFALLLSYSAIALTSCFDSIRLFSFYTGLGCLLNEFGQVTFFMPCLYMNLKRALDRQNCLCQCIGNDEIPTNLETNQALEDENINNIKESTDENWSKNVENRVKSLLKSKILRYILMFLISVYFLFNLTVCCLKFRVGIPMVEILPSESFTRKHMINHLELFDLAPIVVVAFMKPRQYWNVSEFRRIRSFLDDAKSVKGMDRRFEWNWLQDVYEYSKLSPGCEEEPLEFECFKASFMSTATSILLEDDVIFDHNESRPFEITSSRIYLHYKNFIGDQSELEINDRLDWLAYTKYKFGRDELIFYSIIDTYFEAMSELPSQFFSLSVLGIEAVLLTSFLLLVDLKTILLLGLVTVSFTLAVLASMILMAVKLNFVILMHFCMMPAFVSHFFFSTPYLYLYPAVDKTTKNTKVDRFRRDEDMRESNTDLSALKNPNNRRLKQLKFAYSNFIQHSAYFLLIIILTSFILTNFVSTYSFSMLYKFIIVASFNLALHLMLVFPLLLVLFGPVWV